MTRRPDIEAAVVGSVTAIAVVTFRFTTLLVILGGGVGSMFREPPRSLLRAPAGTVPTLHIEIEARQLERDEQLG